MLKKVDCISGLATYNTEDGRFTIYEISGPTMFEVWDNMWDEKIDAFQRLEQAERYIASRK